nr:hypothetical protein [Tanacetum cinerariifolium]
MPTQQDIYAAGSKSRPPMLNKENYVPWSSRLLRIQAKLLNINQQQSEDFIKPKEQADCSTGYEYGSRQTNIDSWRNQNGQIGVQENGNQNHIGNEEYDLMAAAADLDEIEEVNANCILMANLQQASSSGTQTDSAPVYDSDGSAENDNDVISEVTRVEQGRETVEQHSASFEETRALYESLYQNLAVEVEKVNSVNRKLKETNADLTTELARYKNQERFLNLVKKNMTNLKDDELSEKELKQIEADDQAIQTILLVLLEDIYAVVDSCETAQKIWLRMIGGNGGNQFRQYAGNSAGYNDVIGNQGNAAGHNGNQIRCYNCRPRRRDAAYLQTQLLIAQKEEAGIQLQTEEYDLMAVAADLNEIEEVNANCILMANLQQASSSGTQTDSTLVYDTDRSADVHENYDNNEIFNMFTQEEQYTKILEPIPKPQQVP